MAREPVFAPLRVKRVSSTKMFGQPVRRWLRRVALLGVVFHAFVATAAPFEHHDLVCHLKTPQHCTSCLSSPASSGSHTHVPAGASHLADAGRAIAVHSVSESALLTARTTGRSPPAFV